MRVLNANEVGQLGLWLKPLVRTRLQEVMTLDQDVVLGFYSSQGLLWLWLDLSAVRPMALPWSQLPRRFKSKTSPLLLFLRAHFVDRILEAVESHERTLTLVFTDSHKLEIRLVPHARNVIAQAHDKQVSWQKVSALKNEDLSQAPEPRSLDELREQWLGLRRFQPRKEAQADHDRREQQLKKKRAAQSKVEEELQRKLDLPYRAVGDWLKAHQSLDVPREFEPFVDRSRKLAWNIEECYRLARETEGKLEGTRRRLEILAAEIAGLEKGDVITSGRASTPVPVRDVDARTLRVNEQITVMAGKNAKDNLQLLRQARGWDLWIHLRDYPSRHAVLFRNKSTAVPEATLNSIIAWFVELHFGAKYATHEGERVQVLVAECRFVRPIKGDKIGRVTYQNERVFIHKVAPRSKT